MVVLTIRNTGRAAIASAHYDANQPLPLGRPILQMIQKVSANGPGFKASPPPSRVENGTLEIGPGLIQRKQHLTFTVLVDGKPKLEVEPNLIDVAFKVTQPDASLGLDGVEIGAWLSMTAAAAALVLLGFALFT